VVRGPQFEKRCPNPRKYGLRATESIFSMYKNYKLRISALPLVPLPYLSEVLEVTRIPQSLVGSSRVHIPFFELQTNILTKTKLIMLTHKFIFIVLLSLKRT
jgi:hypothetical protein